MPKVRKGEHNPRYYIILPVGVGNLYCRNCEHLMNITGNDFLCNIFFDEGCKIKTHVPLKFSDRFGPVRCQQCKDAGAELQRVKEECRKEGANGEYYRLTQGK